MNKKLLSIFILSYVFSLGAMAKDVEYYVEKNDSLMTISNKFYGTHQKFQMIKDANPNVNPGLMTVGQKLMIPQPTNSVLQVRKLKTKPVVKSPAKRKPVKKKTAKVKSKNSNKKYKKLETVYLSLKNKNQQLKLSNLDLKKQLEAARNTSKYKTEINDLKKNLRSCKGQQKQAHVESLHNYTNLVNSQMQALQEKSRILMQRSWVAKNNQPETCNLHFAPEEQYKKEIFEGLVGYLNDELGTDQVFVDPSSNKLMVRVKGLVVYNYSDPKLKSKYKKIFSKISEYLKELPVAAIDITGHTKYSILHIEGGVKVTGSRFMLKQSLAIRDHLVGQYGWSPELFTVNSFGNGRFSKKLKAKKLFEIEVSFKGEKNARQVAAIDKDVSLKGLADDILQRLKEPKYGSAKVGKEGIELHLARSYFFEGSTDQLSERGRERLAAITEVFARLEDSYYQVVWVPGFTEKQVDTRKTLLQLDSVKSYMVKDLKVPKASVQVSVGTHHNKIKTAFTEAADKVNRRLIFRIRPNSVVTKSINMQK